MYCCLRPELTPEERMVTDIFKIFRVNVEVLSDTQSAHSTIFICENRVFKYVFLSEAALKRHRRVLSLEKQKIPHIIRAISHHETRHGLISEFEYCKSGDLFHFFSRNSVDYAIFNHICTSLVNKLFEIHSTGFCHNDIKPENIFVRHDYDIVIGDIECMRRKKRQRYGTTVYESPMHRLFTATQADLYALAKTVMVCLSFVKDKDPMLEQTVESAMPWLQTPRSFASFTPAYDKWVIFVEKATKQNEAGAGYTFSELRSFLFEFESVNSGINSYIL